MKKKGAPIINTKVTSAPTPPPVQSISRTYGDAEHDYFYKVFAHVGYIYAAGVTDSEGLGSVNALIVKFNKADLSIAARKIYSAAGQHYFNDLFVDGDYVYAVGYTGSYHAPDYGAYDRNCLIVKFNKADLSIAAAKVYGGTAYENFYGVFAEGDYVYAVGYTRSEGQGWMDALIMKFNKADLSIAARKIYGGADRDYFYGVFVDGDYVYAVGDTRSEGQGSYDALIVKFNKGDLSIAARKIYGGADDEVFVEVLVDGDYVYAAGYTGSEGQGLMDTLIVKFNKAALSIAAAKVYGGIWNDNFSGLSIDGDYVYCTGYTRSEGVAAYTGLIVKFNKGDLSIAARKIYGGADDNMFWDISVDAEYIYAVAETYVGGLWNSLCLIFKSPKAIIPTGNSVPPGFFCADSGLILADSALTLADSGLILADSALTLADSALILADSALNLSDPYVITA